MSLYAQVLSADGLFSDLIDCSRLFGASMLRLTVDRGSARVSAGVASDQLSLVGDYGVGTSIIGLPLLPFVKVERLTGSSSAILVEVLPHDADEVAVFAKSDPLTGRLKKFAGAARADLQELRDSILRYEAVYKLLPGATDGQEFNMTTGLSSAAYTGVHKLEIEAPFSAVRLLWRNRAANAVTGCKALVGVTETNDYSTSDNMAQPVIGGTAYPVVAASNTINGLRAVTWGGAETVDQVAATTEQQFKLSDLAPLSNIPRADGGSRPLLLMRQFINGAVSNFAFCGGAGITQARYPIAAMRNRTFQASSAFRDAIGTPGATFSMSNTLLEIDPVITFRQPVLSVWGVGDSITQGSALVAAYFSTWGARACFDVSTPELPVIWANFGSSSATSHNYLNTFENALEAGAPAPSVVVSNCGSINTLGGTPTTRNIEQMRADAFRLIGICKRYAIPFIVWWPTLQNDDLNTAEDALRKAFLTEMQAAAAANGIIWMGGFAAIGDGATPERYKAAYDYGDGLHPNETAMETVMAPALVEVLQAIKDYLGYTN